MKEGKSGSIRFSGWKTGNSAGKGNLKTGGSCRTRERSKENAGGTDYRRYDPSPLEWAEAAALGVALAGAVSYTCYRSWTAFLILLVPAVAVPLRMREMWRKKRLRQLELQFKEAIQLIAASLAAGLSVENAILSCRHELKQMYGENGMMCRELSHMAHQMDMNRPVEELMSEFAVRSGLEEAENFARIFQIAKRSGGQLTPIIQHTVQVMDDRFQVKEEIRTLTASRQFEQKVMNAVPFLMILYIDATSPGFFDVMYGTALGRIVMTGCLAVYLASCFLAERILDIQIM